MIRPEKKNRKALSPTRYGKIPAVAFLTSCIALLSSCSGQSTNEESNLAVAKIPPQELQSDSFVALNEDKPGTPVTVQRYLVPGKFTIVYFYSPYSSPEENFAEALENLVAQRNDLAVRTVNINREGVQGIDWESPAVEEAEVNSLPYFFIYATDGSLRAHGRPAKEQIIQWVRAPIN